MSGSRCPRPGEDQPQAEVNREERYVPRALRMKYLDADMTIVQSRHSQVSSRL